jgi:predicted oxidoreductase (fatty acid repression mutant protein)
MLLLRLHPKKSSHNSSGYSLINCKVQVLVQKAGKTTPSSANSEASPVVICEQVPAAL